MTGDMVCIKGPAVSGTQVDKFSVVTHEFEMIDDSDDEGMVCGLIKGSDDELCVPKEAVFDCGSKEPILFYDGAVFNAMGPYGDIEKMARFSEGYAEKARRKLLALTPKKERASLDINALLFPNGHRELELLDVRWESFDLGGWTATLFDYQYQIVYHVFLPRNFTVADVSIGIHQAIAHKQIINHLLGE